MTFGPKRLLDCVIQAAKETGMYALQNISRRREILRTYRHDVKLALDVECQAIATRIIQGTFPDHAILGEEDTADNENSITENEYLWIIDPIDGTVNFSHGLTNWCCSIAVQQHGKSVAGAVYLPVTNELYTATADQPAMMNGTNISVSSVNNLAESIILTGLDKSEVTQLPSLEIFKNISESTQKARIMGSAAADMCQVAAGKADGYYESGIYIWDVAAAGLIIERAGGRSEIISSQGNSRISFLATNGLIHSNLKALITSGKN